MSANNQILVKEHKGRWYVFDNVNAESWDENEKNELSLKEAEASFGTRAEALEFAHDLEMIGDGTEYGVGEFLAKDGADVKII